jgi:hypothetical protein
MQAVAQEWTKHFRLGMQVTLNIDADFSIGGVFDVPFEEGRYSDGYVFDDDLGSPGGDTTFWGYQNASQYNEMDEAITFQRIESFEVTGSSEQHSADNPYIGIDLAYGGPIRRWREALIGWEVGYSFLPIRIADRRRLAATIGHRTVRHDTTGVEIPAAPYEGGPSGVEQPPISLDPFSNDLAFPVGTVTGSREIDVGLHNLKFGPTIHYEFARRWAVQGSAGGALGFITGDYVFNETVTPTSGGLTTQNIGKIGMSEFVYGGYANGLVLFHVEPHGDIYAGVQFMSLSGTEVNEGGRRARLNLGAAFSFLIGVNWPF